MYQNKSLSLKLIARIICFLMIFQLIPLNWIYSYAATYASVSYSIQGEPKVGQTIEISVDVSNIQNLYGASVDFVFDPTLLQVESITKGSIFGSKSSLTPLGENGEISLESGQASFVSILNGNQQGVSNNGSIAIIKCRVLKEGNIKIATTTSNNALSQSESTFRVKLANNNGEKIDYTSNEQNISLLSEASLYAGTYQEGNEGLRYSGTWVDFSSNNYDGGGIKLSATADSALEFNFEGTSFEWYGNKSVGRGIAKVYVDDKEVATVDCYNSKVEYKKLLYKSEALAQGTHKVRIVNTGLKNQNSESIFIDVDKIVINTKPLSEGSYQENINGIIYNGEWIEYDSPNYDGGSLRLNSVPDSSVEFNFDGTSFEWYGNKAASRGIAKIYIDNKEVGTVDAYSEEVKYKELIYKSDALLPGTHNVKIVNTGLKNPKSSSILLDVDKIVINSKVIGEGNHQESSEGIMYKGNWKDYSSPNYENGSIKLTEIPNSAFEFVFEGTSFEWYGNKAPSRGIAKIFIDGNEVGLVDCYSNSVEYKKLLYMSQNLKPGMHTVKIVNTDQKNSKSMGTLVDIDKIVVNATTLISGSYQEDNEELKYVGNWVDYRSSNYDGGSLKLSSSAEEAVEFDFYGTSFEWYGNKAQSRGIAQIFIDGKEITTIDCYSDNVEFRKLLYKSNNLLPGTHKVKIVNSGLKNPKSTNTLIDMDKIIINSNVMKVGNYQENYKDLMYEGTWEDYKSNNYDGGALKLSEIQNSSIEFNIEGNSFEWYGNKAPSRGIAAIYVDGKEVAQVDCFSSKVEYKKMLYKSENLGAGTHNIKIVNIRAKNPNSSGTLVDVDKIVIK